MLTHLPPIPAEVAPTTTTPPRTYARAPLDRCGALAVLP
jgi:hypothetical protein